MAQQHRLVFIRHGESMGNAWAEAYRNDETNFLSDLGIKQVELSAIDLRRQGFDFTHVISSNLTRARQTAVIVMQAMGDWKRSIQIEPGLNEFVEEHNVDYGGETSAAHHSRVIQALTEKVLPLMADGDVLCVSHYFTMCTIFETLLGPGIRRVLNVGYSGRVHIPNGIPFIYDPSAENPMCELNPYRSRHQH